MRMRARPDSGCGQAVCQVYRRRQRHDEPTAVTEARKAGRGCGHGGMRLAARPGYRPAGRAGGNAQHGQCGGGDQQSPAPHDPWIIAAARRAGPATPGGRSGLHPATRTGMLHGMATDTMDPATAVTWGPFIQAAFEQFVSAPGEVNPSAIKNMPAGYTLVRTIQMTDFFGPVQTRVFYGFVAVGGVRPQPGWRARDAPGRGRDREHATEAAGMDVRLATGGRRHLRRTLRRPQHRVMANLQPGRRRPVFPHRYLRRLPARHHRVRDQLPGEGALEPGLRPRAEHLPARALPRDGAAGPGLQASLLATGRRAHPRCRVPAGTRARAAAGLRIRFSDTPSP